jgi:hypothetical protein
MRRAVKRSSKVRRTWRRSSLRVWRKAVTPSSSVSNMKPVTP